MDRYPQSLTPLCRNFDVANGSVFPDMVAAISVCVAPSEESRAAVCGEIGLVANSVHCHDDLGVGEIWRCQSEFGQGKDDDGRRGVGLVVYESD